MTQKTMNDPDEQLREWAEREGIWNSDEPKLTGITSTRIGMGRTLLFGLAYGGILTLMLTLMTVATGGGIDRWQHHAERQASAQVVDQWLESQRTGRDGTEYWSSESWVEPVRLFAVRSWEVVDETLPGWFTVRIESSNKAGIPIVKLWTIKLDDYDTNPRIYSVEETVSD